MENKKIIISKTGIINGRGSNKYKWISNLTKTEREAVRNGDTVLVPDTDYIGNGSGSDCRSRAQYKIVTCYRGKYGHKNYNGTV